MYVCSLGRNKTETKGGASFGAFNQTLIIFENSTSIFVFTQFILGFFIHFILCTRDLVHLFTSQSFIPKFMGQSFLKGARSVVL